MLHFPPFNIIPLPPFDGSQWSLTTQLELASHFMTMIPLRVAALRSILSTPVPARPISFNPTPAVMTSSVTLVADLTMRAL